MSNSKMRKGEIIVMNSQAGLTVAHWAIELIEDPKQYTCIAQ